MFSIYLKSKKVFKFNTFTDELSKYAILFKYPNYNETKRNIVIGNITLLEVYNIARTTRQWKFVITFESAMQWYIFQMICEKATIEKLKQANCLQLSSSAIDLSYESFTKVKNFKNRMVISKATENYEDNKNSDSVMSSDEVGEIDEKFIEYPDEELIKYQDGKFLEHDDIFIKETNEKFLSIDKSHKPVAMITMDSDHHRNVFKIQKNGLNLTPDHCNMFYILAELIQEDNFAKAGQFITASS